VGYSESGGSSYETRDSEGSRRNRIGTKALGLPSRLSAVQSSSQGVAGCPEKSPRQRDDIAGPPGGTPRRPETEMYLPRAGGWHVCAVQVLSMKPGNYALGSQLSRAAARSLLIARKASEEDQLRFQTVSIVDGSRVDFDGLAEVIRVARMRNQAGEMPDARAAIDGTQESNRGRRTECLSGRIKMARQRALGPETMP
jgi:hypothetical protein